MSSPADAEGDRDHSRTPRRVAVIGAGISGLAAAFRLRELEPETDIVVLDRRHQPGGVLETSHRDGFCLEHGADNFITNVPWAVDLCERLGIAGDLMETDAARRRTFVVHRGRLEPVPDGFMLLAPARLGPLLRTRLLSPWGKLRLAAEYFMPRRAVGGGDESLASFARRRLGREVFERIVQPLVAGIYTADAEQLSLRATLARFMDMEREHRSLIRAARRESRESESAKNSSGARYGLFTTPRGGLQAMIAALVDQLPAKSLQLSRSVSKISREGDARWRVTHVADDDTNGTAESFDCDAVIVTTPAPVAATLLEAVDAQLAEGLRTIPYAGSVVVLAGYRREQITHPLDGFGFVVPEREGRDILACSFSSVKYPGRAPEGCELLRVFLGGAGRPEFVEMDEAKIRQVVDRELGELLGVRGEPVVWQVARYPGSMPQYHLGHLDRVGDIERRVAEIKQLELAGNAYHGVGIPNCIRSGELAAERLLGRAESRQTSAAVRSVAT